MPEEQACDVIVVGSGIAGTAAALELAEAGVSFLVVDRADQFGGTARRGGVGSSIAGTPMQKDAGIADSWELAVRDLCANGNDADTGWARFYYRRSLKDVWGWYEALGVPFEKVVWHEGDSVARWHLPLGGGLRIMDHAWRRFGELNVQHCWRLGHAVTDLIREDGAIVGVEVEDTQGKRSTLRARAVLLAAGGFGGNARMGRAVGPLFRDTERLLAGGNPNAQGELHSIVERHGGRLAKMHDVYGYANGTPDYRDPSGERGVVMRGPHTCIWVNRAGSRFHDEDMHFTGRTSTDHLLKQPGQTCWVIFDEAALPEILIQDHYMEPGIESPAATVQRFVDNSPYFRSADSLGELAGALGLPADALAKTIADWNALIASGAECDPLTGRKLAGLKPVGGHVRWWSVQFFPMLRKTLGGVATDLKCRVLDKDMRPIRGLYAAGELAGMGGGGLAGAHPLEGLMAGGSLFSGRIAGRWAGRFITRGLPRDS